MWKPGFIRPHIARDTTRRVYRVLLARHLLSNAVTSTPAARNQLQNLLNSQRQRQSTRMPASLTGYDDAIAYVFKHPHVQGSTRFGRARATTGTLYAAYEPETALAERAFHLLDEHRRSAGNLGRGRISTKLIEFDLAPADQVDLMAPPFNQDQSLFSVSTRYAYTQDFADAVRQTPAIRIAFPSVRDLNGGTNVALLDWTGLATRQLDHGLVRDWTLTCIKARDEVVAQDSPGRTLIYRFGMNNAPY